MSEETDRTALLSAGYCGEPYRGNKGHCTRPFGKHRDGYHVDYYNGRKRVTDTEGYRWPQH